MQPVAFLRTSPKSLGEVSTQEGDKCDSCGSVLELEGEGYQNPLSLDALLVQHPHSTFFVQVGGSDQVQVQGSSYLGVEKNDILTIDRSIKPTIGKLVLAVCEGEFTLCRFTEHEGRQFLVCGIGRNSSVELGPENSTVLWGVVTAVVKQV